MKAALNAFWKLLYGVVIAYGVHAHRDHLLISATAIMVWIMWMDRTE